MIAITGLALIGFLSANFSFDAQLRLVGRWRNSALPAGLSRRAINRLPSHFGDRGAKAGPPC
jgi:hypothetical protein